MDGNPIDEVDGNPIDEVDGNPTDEVDGNPTEPICTALTTLCLVLVEDGVSTREMGDMACSISKYRSSLDVRAVKDLSNGEKWSLFLIFNSESAARALITDAFLPGEEGSGESGDSRGAAPGKSNVIRRLTYLEGLHGGVVGEC